MRSPSAAVEAGQQALSSARLPTAADAELFVRRVELLRVDLDPATGRALVARGEELQSAARVQVGGNAGLAWAHGASAALLRDLLERAASSARPDGDPLPPLEALTPAPPPAGEAPEVDPASAGALAEALLSGARALTKRIQVVLVRQSVGYCVVLRRGGHVGVQPLGDELGLVRCEAPLGALVDGVAGRLNGANAKLEPLFLRVADGLEALAEAGGPAPAGLPWLLRSAPAAPLVSGLGWALRGNVAASLPSLSRAVGKQIFPAALTLTDQPAFRGAPQLRHLDDEGLSATAETLVEAGRLMGFLQCAATSKAAPGRSSRGFRGESLRPAPLAVNLMVHPAAEPLRVEEDHLELVARLETFTTMPKPGTVALQLAGYEVRGGKRGRRVGPIDVELPLLSTWRRLRRVGSDLAFFPAVEGCGTPSLLFAAEGTAP